MTTITISAMTGTENWHLLRGTPVRYWFDSELADIFGVTERPGKANADALYDQIAAQLGVRRTTIGRWRREGRLEARICNEMGQWLYAPGQPRPSDHSAPRETAPLGAQDISRVGGAV